MVADNHKLPDQHLGILNAKKVDNDWQPGPIDTAKEIPRAQCGGDFRRLIDA